MSSRQPELAGNALTDHYEVFTQVQASMGGPRIILGNKGKCRYCGTSESSLFKRQAHTFPEALGNKWVFSNDECDQCNSEIFARYDDALANCISPIITLGGTRGKGNTVRQTGRRAGKSILQRNRTHDNRPSIFFETKDTTYLKRSSFNTYNQELTLVTPVASVPFKPRFAYKALSKMGYALLPESETKNYTRLQQWLINTDDIEDFPVLPVGLSLGTLGNAPALVCGVLLRRKNPVAPVPHIIFLFCAGSACLQIDLKSDHLEDHVPPTMVGGIAINFRTVIGAPEISEEIEINYGAPTFFNWASKLPEPQPIEAFSLRFNTQTSEGQFTPIFRQRQPSSAI